MLNSTYRQKTGPTNVLSFPFDLPEDIQLDMPILGDIVVCADVVNREAQEQHKTLDVHWAHMIIHGVFHLLGYDHETDHDAEKMERLEINVMQSLGFNNPYETREDHHHE
jgi:probable rRNA maturation factor